MNQMTAGGLVLAGVLLGAFVSPWFLTLSAFVGTGLMFAGASGWCGMAFCSRACHGTVARQRAPRVELLS